jgi:hypothetical protein
MARTNQNKPIRRECVVCHKVFRLAKRDVTRCATCSRKAREAVQRAKEARKNGKSL